MVVADRQHRLGPARHGLTEELHPAGHREPEDDGAHQSGGVVRELLDSTPIDGIRPTGGPNGPRQIKPSEQSAASA